MSTALQISIAEYDRLTKKGFFDRGHTVRPLRFPKLKLSVTKLFDWFAN